ncbi:PAS/PAC sensor signal transduction histidine kinase [Halorubrum distributum JCM 9100]|uniref:histidine kinase n=2 Tax=Halorubrum distributum TaxID=29283 RepID=M0ESS4_9EURY|nr:PAS domain S-box protein [Halorubrum distributum]ELZ50750.1 PAS/PAC sensor signal transduction histidine kinase [Halorubrum distributum JCM 9100]ELZ53189.1 PAS/PAC sensor signal transduction histidine kinase [Halorubrum distributum JCM 10118]
MTSALGEHASVLVLNDDPELAEELGSHLGAERRDSDDGGAVETFAAAPDGVDDDRLAGADVTVVVDEAGLERVRPVDRVGAVVAYVDDPTGRVATDPLVDAVAGSREALSETASWLLARDRRSVARSAPTRTPSRIEQLNAGMTELAAVRSVDEAYRATIAVAEQVFPGYQGVVAVRDGEWVEPVVASSGTPVEDCNRVRVGSGVAGRAVQTGDASIAPNPNPESRFDTVLTVPVGDDVVFQLASDDTGSGAEFDDADRRLAELLASHLEETLDRIDVTETLRAERDRLLALFTNVPDPAIAYDYVDGDPIVRQVNDAFEATFGYEPEAVIGESVDDYIVPPDAESEANDLNEQLQRGENVRREVTRITADGPRHFILHVIPIHLDAANAAGYAIYTDVTDRREREETLRRQNERLDEFASIVSHDLRNPLSVAEGYVDLARETGDTDHLDRAADAIDRMDELVEDLLSLAREGRSVGETDPVSLATVAREAWSSVDTGGATLTVEADGTLEANRTRLRELLENVFRNSAEHGRDSPEDPLSVRVGAGTLRDDDGEEVPGFYVEDDGTGLPDDADRVFDSGFTTEESGTGLGLAISERIAEAHGWTAHALAGADGGARFEFRTG